MSPHIWVCNFRPTCSPFSFATIMCNSFGGTIVALLLPSKFSTIHSLTYSTSLFVSITRYPSYEVRTLSKLSRNLRDWWSQSSNCWLFLFQTPQLEGAWNTSSCPLCITLGSSWMLNLNINRLWYPKEEEHFHEGFLATWHRRSIKGRQRLFKVQSQ